MKSPQPERNAQIVAEYHAGATLLQVAARHGLSESRISYIVQMMGGRLTGEERGRRLSEYARQKMNDPAMRARISATMAARWAAGFRAGRPRLFADDPAKREEYLTLRDACGAAYARAALGLAA